MSKELSDKLDNIRCRKVAFPKSCLMKQIGLHVSSYYSVLLFVFAREDIVS
jgi:hypothetical protein